MRELYVLASDPGEMRNLAACSAQHDRVSQLKKQLREHMQAVGDEAREHFTN